MTLPLRRLCACPATVLRFVCKWSVAFYRYLFCLEAYIVTMQCAGARGALNYICAISASSGLGAIEKAEKLYPGAYVIDVMRADEFEASMGLDSKGESRRQDKTRTVA
jgi:hypothetical protein